MNNNKKILSHLVIGLMLLWLCSSTDSHDAAKRRLSIGLFDFTMLRSGKVGLSAKSGPLNSWAALANGTDKTFLLEGYTAYEPIFCVQRWTGIAWVRDTKVWWCGNGLEYFQFGPNKVLRFPLQIQNDLRPFRVGVWVRESGIKSGKTIWSERTEVPWMSRKISDEN